MIGTGNTDWPSWVTEDSLLLPAVPETGLNVLKLASIKTETPEVAYSNT